MEVGIISMAMAGKEDLLFVSWQRRIINDHVCVKNVPVNLFDGDT
jgi:hypothetical protein